MKMNYNVLFLLAISFHFWHFDSKHIAQELQEELITISQDMYQEDDILFLVQKLEKRQYQC